MKEIELIKAIQLITKGNNASLEDGGFRGIGEYGVKIEIKSTESILEIDWKVIGGELQEVKIEEKKWIGSMHITESATKFEGVLNSFVVAQTITTIIDEARRKARKAKK